MYIDVVPNRNSAPAILLRESYREGTKIKKRTIANLSGLPMNVVEGLKVVLRGGVAFDSPEALFSIVRSLPHGHVAAVLGTARNCGVADWLFMAHAARRDGHQFPWPAAGALRHRQSPAL